ncbi:MAG TPA: glycosyltransferase, partial [Yeosuana sp.]
MQLQFSFIIPVYNRPDEIQELLQSFTELEFYNDYEIVIVEDGSTIPSKEII